MMIGSLVHESYLGQLPTWTSVLWIVVASATFALGARLFRHMAYLPARWRRGRWYMMTYGLTGYSVAKIGWLFDDEKVADRFWSPIGYVCALFAIVGAVLVFECLFSHLEGAQCHVKWPSTPDTEDPT